MDKTLFGFKRLVHFDKPYHLWNDETDPISFIKFSQGYFLGNCYFMSALASIAEKPEIVKSLFHRNQDGKLVKQGIYEIKCFINGVPRIVQVDDLLPITKEGKFVFGEPNLAINSLQVWALILEKAWGKIVVNFERQVAGWAHECLTILTGAPSKDYLIKNYDLEEVWTIVYESLQKGYLVGCGTNGAGDDTVKDIIGLAQSHAYGALDARIVIHPVTREVLRLIKLHNPWTQETYKGKCSESNAEFWTDELKAELGHTIKDDGVIWLTVEEFKASMLYACVTLYNKDNYHNYIHSEGDEGETKTFLFTLEDDKNWEDLDVMVTHYDSRMYPFGAKPTKVRSFFELFKWNPFT